MTKNQAAPAPKQLKKNDFLNAVSEQPMTREELVDALDEFEFLGSYLDYLTEHFEAQGKITRNEDGTIQRKGKKAATSRKLFRIVDGEAGPEIDEWTLGKGDFFTDEVKAEGWRSSESAAVKAACQQVFASYKADTASIRALLADETGAE